MASASITRRSHHSASSIPPATAEPLTAAITGLDSCSRDGPIGAVLDMSGSSGLDIERRSAPAQKVPPAPQRTATDAPSSASNSVKASASAAAVGPSTALRTSARSTITVETLPLRSTRSRQSMAATSPGAQPIVNVWENGRMSPAAPRRPAPPATIPAAMAGAVDLAAVRARSEAAARAAEAPVPTAGAYVVDVTEATFQSEVLDRSFQVPVLIDLWADWCQPCKQLSPILERLANEGGGAWVLAKIDVDANPRISQALQVQSIPTVFAVIGGQLAPGFQGALPEAQVRQFVDAVIDAGRESKLPGMPPGEPGADAAGGAQQRRGRHERRGGRGTGPAGGARLVAAEEALEAGDFDTAVARYQEIVSSEPAQRGGAAGAGSGAAAAAGRPDTRPDDGAGRRTIRTTYPGTWLPRICSSPATRSTRHSIGSLGLLARTSAEDRDAVRERLIEYFDLLGPDDPRVAPARRRMAQVLF